MGNIPGKLIGAFIFLKGRLREPSTYASLSAVMATFGLHADPGVIQDWMNTLTLVFGLLGFFVKEAKPETEV